MSTVKQSKQLVGYGKAASLSKGGLHLLMADGAATADKQHGKTTRQAIEDGTVFIATLSKFQHVAVQLHKACAKAWDLQNLLCSH